MKRLSKKEQLILVVFSVVLFGGRILLWASAFTSNERLIIISFVMRCLFYLIYILVVAKESKIFAVLLFAFFIIELFVWYPLFL